MKKVLPILLCLIMIATFTACKDNIYDKEKISKTPQLNLYSSTELTKYDMLFQFGF